MKARLALICFFIVCILWFVDGNAADVSDFRVNDDFGTTYQGYSNLAVDLDGNFVVSWYDKRNGDNDIYLQLFDRLGNRQGGNRRVNDDAVGNEQLRPSLMKDQLGKFAVVWQDFRITGYPFNGDIYGQRFNADGSLISTNQRINDDFGVDTQGWQDIDTDDLGNYVVVWEDLRNGNYDIYAQRYHKSGTKLGTNFKVNDDAGAAYQHNPKIAVDGDGDFVVVWYDNRSGRDNIMGQRFNSSGVAQGTNFLINDNIATNKCVFPDVACDYNGNFVVSWIDYRNGAYPTNPDIYAREYWANGDSRSANFKVNTDGGSSSQEEVTVGMDFLGNFIIAWRDNRQGNYDIFAQYYKSDGSALGGNYRVNSDIGTATQSFPNVTMDGINIYYTWTDDRNGSFDVYARITEYGAPTIVITPTAFTFVAQAGSANPASQNLLINNLGYGVLNWSITDDQPWLSVAPAAGTGPATVAVSVNLSGLTAGEYAGRITISDTSGKDSTRTAVVALSVQAPLIQITPTVIDVEIATHQSPPTDKYVLIENAGIGSLNWTATGMPNWLKLSASSGTAPSAVDLIFQTDSLPGPGDYTATVSIASAQAANSPQSFVVNLLYVANDPTLNVDPTSLSFGFVAGTMSVPSQDLVIFNSGTGTLDWQAASDVEWLTITPDAMLGDGVAKIGLKPNLLSVGNHSCTLTVSAVSAANSPLAVPISVVVQPPADTLSIGSANALAGEPFNIEIALTSFVALDSLDAKLIFDQSTLFLDSVAAIGRASSVAFWSLQDSQASTSLRLRRQPGAGFLPSGSGPIGLAYLRAQENAGSGDYPLTASGTRWDSSGAAAALIMNPGSISISSSTPVYPVDSPILPADFSLGPSYPNPFNAATTIPFALPRASYLRLDVLNILGQEVRSIYSGQQPAGAYQATWSGDDDHGRELPSGIYFIRLFTIGQSLIIKTLLLK